MLILLCQHGLHTHICIYLDYTSIALTSFIILLFLAIMVLKIPCIAQKIFGVRLHISLSHPNMCIKTYLQLRSFVKLHQRYQDLVFSRYWTSGCISSCLFFSSIWILFPLQSSLVHCQAFQKHLHHLNSTCNLCKSSVQA